jgi:hypothetical protein
MVDIIPPLVAIMIALVMQAGFGGRVGLDILNAALPKTEPMHHKTKEATFSISCILHSP